jgi:single-strand selective monofunctional uracil DNA glycosylase
MTPLDSLLAAHTELHRNLTQLSFSAPVAFVYHPLGYAWDRFAEYLRRYASEPGRVLWVGMNPGPFGMAQTGVPFGDVGAARDWLGLEGPVGRPAVEHPSRPVLGFGLKRSEGSGKRLWGWAQQRYGTPEAFFAQFLVLNYCPVLFMDEGGRNVTPDKLVASEREALERACDAGMRQIVAALAPSQIFGIGGYAANRVRTALGGATPVGQLLHPSPANPQANRDWAGSIERTLAEHGIVVPR